MLGLERKHLRRWADYSNRVDWGDVVANRRHARRHPGRKVFIIGPNRCGTTSLHKFFHFNGLKSIHCQTGKLNLAREIRARQHDDTALRRFLDQWTVFSDFVYLTNDEFYEAHGLFETYRRIYPEAWFILNDRDPDAWVASRLRFKSDFLPRYLSACGGTVDDATAKWRADMLAHRAAALRFFDGDPRFLHFQIDGPQPTPIDAVVGLLNPDFRLSARHWWHHNRAETPLQAAGG